MKIIANDVKATDHLLVSQKRIANVAALKDHTLGINSPGDAGDTVARACLAGANFAVTTRAVTAVVPRRAQWVEQKYVNSYLARNGAIAE